MAKPEVLTHFAIANPQQNLNESQQGIVPTTKAVRPLPWDELEWPHHTVCPQLTTYDQQKGWPKTKTKCQAQGTKHECIVASKGIKEPTALNTGSSTNELIESLQKNKGSLPGRVSTRTSSKARATAASKAAKEPGRHDRARLRLQKAADVGRSSASVLLSAVMISAIFII